MEKQSYELIHGLSKYYKTHVIAYEEENHKLVWFLNLRSKVEKMLEEHPNIKLIHLNDGSMGVASLWLQKYTNIPIIITIHGLDIVYPLGLFQQKLVPRLANYTEALPKSRLLLFKTEWTVVLLTFLMIHR
jgi:phosphatidylinositol alpha-1,6-mannosyltransferase